MARICDSISDLIYNHLFTRPGGTVVEKGYRVKHFQKICTTISCFVVVSCFVIVSRSSKNQICKNCEMLHYNSGIVFIWLEGPLYVGWGGNK